MNDETLTQQTWLDHHEAKATLKMGDLWDAYPGPNDKEAEAQYYKPYLSEKESKIIFLHLGCRLTFGEISVRLHIRKVTAQKAWQRAKAKTLKYEGEGKQT